MRKFLIFTALAAVPLFGVAACSEETQQNAAETADRAAADTRDNAEVVEDTLREGAIVASDKVAEGAADLRGELVEDEQTDPNQGDGKLDGTD